MKNYSYQHWVAMEGGEDGPRYVLSPYVRLYSLTDGVVMERPDIEKKIYFHAEMSGTEELIYRLTSGLNRQELETLLCQFGEHSVGAWLSACVQGGVIEVW